MGLKIADDGPFQPKYARQFHTHIHGNMQYIQLVTYTLHLIPKNDLPLLPTSGIPKRVGGEGVAAGMHPPQKIETSKTQILYAPWYYTCTIFNI